MESSKIKVKAMCIITRNCNEIMATRGFDPVKNESFGRLIGGHVEFGETAAKALAREFKEELNTTLENLKFLKVLENVFVYNSKPGHEVIFLYKGTLSDKSLYKKEDMVVLDKPEVKMTWISLDKVKAGEMKLYPDVDYENLLKV